MLFTALPMLRQLRYVFWNGAVSSAKLYFSTTPDLWISLDRHFFVIFLSTGFCFLNQFLGSSMCIIPAFYHFQLSSACTLFFFLHNAWLHKQQSYSRTWSQLYLKIMAYVWNSHAFIWEGHTRSLLYFWRTTIDAYENGVVHSCMNQVVNPDHAQRNIRDNYCSICMIWWIASGSITAIAKWASHISPLKVLLYKMYCHSILMESNVRPLGINNR